MDGHASVFPCNAGSWLLIYAGEFLLSEVEVEEREQAARDHFGGVCYTWGIDNAQVSRQFLHDAAQKGAYLLMR